MTQNKQDMQIEDGSQEMTWLAEMFSQKQREYICHLLDECEPLASEYFGFERVGDTFFIIVKDKDGKVLLKQDIGWPANL